MNLLNYYDRRSKRTTVSCAKSDVKVPRYHGFSGACRNIFPLVHAGYIVLADRYVYTAYARDIVRGCDPRWVRQVYEFAPLLHKLLSYWSGLVDQATFS